MLVWYVIPAYGLKIKFIPFIKKNDLQKEEMNEMLPYKPLYRRVRQWCFCLPIYIDGIEVDEQNSWFGYGWFSMFQIQTMLASIVHAVQYKG